MNCEQAVELLPWLLNGSLDPDERRQVLEHVGECASCRRGVADTRLAWEVFDQHLPAEALIALAWGETPTGVDPALAELHLASCPECAAELELVRTSRRLEEDDRIAVLTPRARPSSPVTRPSWTGWRAAALAAGLAGVVAATGWWQTAQRADSLEDELARRPAVAAPAPDESQPSASVPSAPAGGAGDQAAELKKKLDQSEQTQEALQKQATELESRLEQLTRLAQGGPQLNTFVDTVFPLAAVVRGGEVESKKVPANLDATLLLSTDPQGKVYPSYDLEVLDANGKALWSAPGLRRDEKLGAYNFSFPKGFLRPGTYTIQVYGRSGSTREPAERYQIRVE
jgi:hypothetical protein